MGFCSNFAPEFERFNNSKIEENENKIYHYRTGTRSSTFDERKCLREWQGQMCKYVAVKYTFRKANGNLDQRILHLLMTEHCDSIVDCSYDGKAEWVNDNDLMMLRDIFPHGVFGGER